MQNIIKREQGLLKSFLPALIVGGVACALVVIVYGIESVAPGVHDAFHDFRHTLGMACH